MGTLLIAETIARHLIGIGFGILVILAGQGYAELMRHRYNQEPSVVVITLVGWAIIVSAVVAAVVGLVR